MKSLPWLLLVAAATAAEPVKLPLDIGTLKTRDGKVFESAKITGHDAVGVKILHAGGIARVEFDRLPDDLADRFPKDPEAAKNQLAKEAKREAAHDRAVDKAREKTSAEDADSDEDDDGDSTTVEGKPELKGDTAAKIAELKAYIRRLEAGITKAEATVADANAKADKYTRTATTYVRTRNANGSTSVQSVTNGSRLTRAEFQRKRAVREQEKIAQAQALISEAQIQIGVLESQSKP